LTQAIVNNQPKFLEWAVREDPAALRQPVAGHGLLLWSVFAGSDECTRVLLDAGLDPAEPDQGGHRAVHEAVVSGRHQMLDGMLAKPGVVEVLDDTGATLLMAAARHGFLDCVRVLLAHHADVNHEKEGGVTALHAAAVGLLENLSPDESLRAPEFLEEQRRLPDPDYPGCVLALLQAGADPFIGQSPSTDSISAAEALASAAWGRPDLFAACFPGGIDPGKAPRALAVAVESDNVPMVKFLLEHGYDPNGPPRSDSTPLGLACAKGSTGSALALLAHGANLKAKEPLGLLPIHHAAKHNDALLIQALVKAGADPSGQDRNGNRPLHYAIEFRALTAVRTLLAAGADPQLLSGILTATEEAEYLKPPYPEITEALHAAATNPRSKPRGR
jgi:ankyrin repeat protein